MSNAVIYAYRGRDAAGKVVKGKLEAGSKAAVVSRLRTMGLAPIEIQESVAGTGLQTDISLGFLDKGVGLKDLAVMARQMATMVGSGLSLLRTLTILSEQTENKKLKSSLTQVRGLVESGTSLSDAFAKFPEVFPGLMIHLVRAGEVGGFLDQSLESAAETFEKDVKLRQTIKSAMTYPVVVLIMALVGMAAMLIFIVPVFQKMFESLGGELPLPTQILVVISQNMIWMLLW